MRNLKIIIALFFMLCAQLFYAQQKEVYYYYQGEKQYLTLNKNFIFVSSTNKNSVTNLKGIRNKRSISSVKKDNPTNILSNTGKFRGAKERYWRIVELNPTTDRSYQIEINNLKKENDNVVVASFYSNEFSDRIGATNYFSVKLFDEKDYPILEKLAKENNVEIIGQGMFSSRWYTLSVTPTSANTFDVSNKFHETGLFEACDIDLMSNDMADSSNSEDIDFMAYAFLTPNDPSFSIQWGLKNTGQFGGTSGLDINAEAAWNITTGVSSVKVAVLDHGIDATHPELIGQIGHFGFDTESGGPAQLLGPHGTPVAGIIAAKQNNFAGISGVAPNVQLVPISNSLAETTNSRKKRGLGIEWAVNNNFPIINNSWTSPTQHNEITDAINYALNSGRGGKGTIVIFSSANDSNAAVAYPANHDPRIITVGAMTQHGQRNTTSNYGTALDVVAPGASIFTTDINGAGGYTTNGYHYFNQTSAAAPFVSGLAALMLSLDPDLTVNEVSDIIELTAQKVNPFLYTYDTEPNRPNGDWNEQMGYGLIDAYAALAAIAGINTGGCEDNVLVTQDVLPSGLDNRRANVSVTAINVINALATADYSAGDEVRLLPGFHAKSGSNFKAHIQACSRTRSTNSNRPISNKYSLNESVREDEKINEERVNLYPNPSSRMISVKSYESILSYEIYNQFGGKVFQGSSSGQSLDIDVSKFESGVYFLKLNIAGGKVINKRFIRE